MLLAGFLFPVLCLFLCRLPPYPFLSPPCYQNSTKSPSLKSILEIIMQHSSSPMEEHILHHDLSLLPSPSTSSSIEIEEKIKNTVFGDESDEGYHTPTSPRHLIRPANECPPAPKKIKMKKKRKIESRGRRRQCWVEDDEFNDLLNRTKKKTKKADEEIETTNPVMPSRLGVEARVWDLNF